MLHRRLLTLAAALPLLAAACAPTVDPAARADLARKLAAIKPSDRVVQAPRSFLPMPFAAGQWAQYRMLDDDGKPAMVTYKLVDDETGALWIETISETEARRQVVKMRVTMLAGRDPNAMEIRAVKIK